MALTRIRDDDRTLWRAALGALGLDSLDVLHARIIRHLAKDDMLAIQPARHHGRDEELGAVGVLAGVGHGQQSGLLVLEVEVLVGKLLAVDGLPAGAVAVREVTALEHELRDDAVELGVLVAVALLAGAQGAEVLGRLRDDIGVEVEVDVARSVGVIDLEVDWGGHLGGLLEGYLCEGDEGIEFRSEFGGLCCKREEWS